MQENWKKECIIQLNGCMRQLEKMAVRYCPEISGIRIKYVREQDREKKQPALVQESLSELGIHWDRNLRKDYYGAPFLPQWEKLRHGNRVSVSFTEDRGFYVSLTAVHDKGIRGIGIDLASAREFDTVIQDGAYGGGSLFTLQEQRMLQQTSVGRQKQLLAGLFSGKEAAFKSMGRSIREGILPEESERWPAEFLDFELFPTGEMGRYDASVQKGTKRTVEYLGIQNFEILTAQEGELGMSLGICR